VIVWQSGRGTERKDEISFIGREKLGARESLGGIRRISKACKN